MKVRLTQKGFEVRIQVARDEAITFEAKASAFLEKFSCCINPILSVEDEAELALLRLESLKLTRCLDEMRRK